MLDFQKSIRLAEKRLFPLNYTPKRPQSLKKTDFVPVADFSSQEVGPRETEEEEAGRRGVLCRGQEWGARSQEAERETG